MNSRLLKPIWLHPRYRMPKHHSAIEQVENLHIRADALKVKALRVKGINDVIKRKARDGDDSQKCKRCSRRTHSNDLPCVVCEEARLKTL